MTDDEIYAREQASKWAERIQEWRREGTPIQRITVEIPGEQRSVFADRLQELIGIGVVFAGGYNREPLAECWFEISS